MLQPQSISRDNLPTYLPTYHPLCVKKVAFDPFPKQDPKTFSHHLPHKNPSTMLLGGNCVCIWTVPYPSIHPSIYLCMKEGCLFVFVVGLAYQGRQGYCCGLDSLWSIVIESYDILKDFLVFCFVCFLRIFLKTIFLHGVIFQFP